MPHLLKPGMEVTFVGLSEPIMTVVSINAKTEVAVCRYYDEYIKKTVKLKCGIDTLQPASKGQQ
jgi:hypothetical protein